MPIYEFDCAACGERFEDLVPAGTVSAKCKHCSSEETRRVLSAPMPTWRLVKTPGSARQQEIRNAKLHTDTKAKFKESRRKARDAKAKGGGGSG
jgi:putative FmdB family regulatory protein